MSRRLRYSLIALAALVCALGVTVWWAASTETALAWAAARAEAFSGGRLKIESPRGTLLGAIGAARVVYADEDVIVTVTDAEIDLRLRALLRERLDARRARAREVRVELLPTPSTGGPDSIGVPLAISVDRAEVAAFAYVDGDTTFELRDIAGAYSGGPEGHRADVANVRTPWGNASGRVALGAAKPFAIDGSVKFARPDEAWPVEATAAVSGSLLAMKARVDARVKTLTIGLDAATDEAFNATGGVAIDNAAPGTPADGRLPVKRATGKFAYDGTTLRLTDLAADLGVAGRARGEGSLDAAGSRWTLDVEALNLRGLHAPLRETQLAGKIVARLEANAQHVEVDLRERGVAIAATASREGDRVRVTKLRAAAGKGELTGEGTATLAGTMPFEARARFQRFDPADFGDYPAATLNGDFTVAGALEPAWHADVAFTLADSRFRGAPLAGQGKLAIAADHISARDATITLGANRFVANGGFGREGDSFTVEIDARNLAQLESRAAGTLAGQATLSGSTKQPALAFDLRGAKLQWADGAAIESLAAKGGLAARSVRSIELAAKVAGLDAHARLEGEWDGARAWRGTVAEFENRGEYPLTLAAATSLEVAPDRIAVGAALMRGRLGEVSVERLVWADGQLATAGRMRGVPVAPLAALAGWTPVRGTDLRLRGAWSIAMTPRLNGTARIERESGDLILPTDPALPVGLKQLAIDATIADDAIAATGKIDTANLGAAALDLRTSGIARDATLAGRVTANVSSLRVVEQLVGTTAIVDGRAALDLALGGTLGQPSLGGTLTADALRVDLPQHGIELRNGRLRAKLEGEQLTLESLAISGPEGELTASGTLARAGEGTQLAWRAERLRFFNRPNRRLTVTGAGTIALSQTKLALRGELRADEGYIEFAGEDKGRLGDDIVIVGHTAPAKPKAGRALPLDIDMTLDPGGKFRIVGQGLDAYLRGKVRVQSKDDGTIVAQGEIEAARGAYRAFGQKLDIERGKLLFDGPIDNPGLDILALRKNLQVEAGVEVTGTVRAPQVRLTSRPPVPDAEKLSWLVLGRATPDASATDLALLQAAASTLASSPDGAVPIQRRIIEGVGLDEITVRGAAGGAASGQVVAFGKRLSDRVYVEYEQGISAAANLVRLTYALTRTLSVNAQSGQTTSSVGFTYRRSFD